MVPFRLPFSLPNKCMIIGTLLYLSKRRRVQTKREAVKKNVGKIKPFSPN